MSSRSALICATCQRAFNAMSSLAAARNAASRGLRSLGAWMRIAATASRSVGGVGVSSLIVVDDSPNGGDRALRRAGERQDDALSRPLPRHPRADLDGS